MITEHESFPPPADRDISIWRYMDLAKFVWMLQNKALFFCRSDLLGDPYEGYYPKTLAEGEDEFVRQMMASIPDANPKLEQSMRESFKGLLKFTKNARQELFLSCWHMNETESLAMWKLYTSQSESICIRSKYSALSNLLSSECFLGCVRYIDYATGQIGFTNLLNYITHKRATFSHEREARAVVWQHATSPKMFTQLDDKGLLVPVDLPVLIEEIFISPEANPMLRDVVEKLARDFGLRAPVRQSEANAPPPY